MKNTNQSVIQTITRNKKANFAFGISKLLIFFLLFSALGMKAQSPPIVEPFPALHLGQTMLIDQNDPLWDPAMIASTITRNQAQEYVNNYPNGQPTEYVSCHGSVCCRTEYLVGSDGKGHYVTVCWDNVREVLICLHVQ